MGDSEGVGETAWKDEEPSVTLTDLRYLFNDIWAILVLSSLLDPLASVLAHLADHHFHLGIGGPVEDVGARDPDYGRPSTGIRYSGVARGVFVATFPYEA